MSNTLELNCLVSGDDPTHIFTIEIENNKTVSALRTAIKDKKTNTFQHVDAHALTLWKVSFAVGPNLKGNLSKFKLVDEQPLWPVEELWEVFPESPLRKYLHIIVQPPPVVIYSDPAPVLQLNCLISGDDVGHVFPIDIVNNKTVSALKEAIKDKKTHMFQHVEVDALTLWKVSFAVGPNLEENVSNFKLVEEQSLWPVEELWEVFLEPPLRKYLHIVIRAPPVANLPSNDNLAALHGKLQEINTDPKWYSNPCNTIKLPFPFMNDYLPTDRFRLESFPVYEFEYMGRERFSELWNAIQSMGFATKQSRLYISGTMGYRKSHILAALACLLSRLGNRVVYMPDCRQALLSKLSYVQSALLCAFSDPPSSSKRDEIRRFTCLDDALKFCGRLLRATRLYFVVDQINAFEEDDAQTDTIPNTEKYAFSEFLQEVNVGHYSITSASMNYRTAIYMAKNKLVIRR